MIDWMSFTPQTALYGGALIGLSAGIYLLFNGKIAGVSGILGGFLTHLLRGQTTGQAIRIAFLMGLVISPWIWSIFASVPPVDMVANKMTLILAGLLVGVGTRMGNGCTSGHGICGLSRFSIRSLVSVVTFMTAGFVTVFVIKHIIH